MEWTKNQRKVIDARDRNLLVSAAAGSGKTAVLVERIMARITDTKEPIDIDKLLVVTFTKAAAAEMRERIGDAIYKRLQAEPANLHLRRQQLYLGNALITTIDSFCLQVVREHFYQINLDPGFRIADQAELKLLQSDVVKELLEEQYQEANEAFLQFVESYVPGRKDTAIEEMILRIYEFSMSYPFPQQWLTQCEEQYDNPKHMEAAGWYQYITRYIDAMLKEVLGTAKLAVRIAEEEDGPQHYAPMLRNDVNNIEAVLAADFDGRVQLLLEMQYDTLARKTINDVDPDKKEQVAALRKQIKEQLKKLGQKYYKQPLRDITEQLQITAKNAAVLTNLTRQFIQKFRQAKDEAGIVDFSDLEHFALEILVEEQADGTYGPTEIARTYSKQFAEIMIDEYQDSNFVQELILQSVSGKEDGKHHLFMVGDVKQSIYRFRLARPELFLEKYANYELDGEENEKIILDQNFRSRNQVLSMVNQLFYHAMIPQVGGITYNEEHALYYGAKYYPEAGKEMQAELLLVETGSGSNVDVEDGIYEAETDQEEALTNKQMEAYVIAERIATLVKEGFLVYDKKSGQMRPCSYKDIVILLRSPKGYGDVMTEVLMAQGIPCVCQLTASYFDSVEVSTVLDLLAILDNPKQDIPLAAILLSPIGGLDDSELAELTLYKKEQGLLYLADALKQWDNKKAQNFVKRLERYGAMVFTTSIYDLITYILEDSGYGYYVAALPSGTRRLANLEQLKQKAVEYEETKYRGLFHFVRYINKIRESGIDTGEGAAMAQSQDAVRIMSIHGSKGLEFPIVFVSSLAKKFNLMDSRKSVVMEPDLGIGIDYRNPVTRQKADTLIRQAVATKSRMEALGEELRILYVALTRAREKLILTANVPNVEKTMTKWRINRGSEEELTLPLQTIAGASSYLDWIGSSYLKNRIRADFSLQVVDGTAVAGNLMVKQAEQSIRYAALTNWDTTRTYEQKTKEQIQSMMEYEYPYAKGLHIPIKYSVSELKMAHMSEEEAKKVKYGTEEKQPIVPEFIKGIEPVNGATRGTAYHKVFELMDFENPPEKAQLKQWIMSIPIAGIQQVKEADIAWFLETTLFHRMAAAESGNGLFAEQPFVFGVPAQVVDAAYPAEETVLIQGVMDAYFEEEDGFVIVDYKTDHVETAQQLKDRYETQLDYYAKALNQITGKQVKEKILCSIHLHELVSWK